MRILKLSIENFKSLKKVEFEKFSTINMIFGHNNSGKSNVFKFIELLFSRKLPENKETRVDKSRLTRNPFEEQTSYEKTSNFWEGTIEDVPFIYHKNTKDAIKFDVTVEVAENEVADLTNIAELYVIYPPEDKKIILRIIGEIRSLGRDSASMKLLSTHIGEHRIYSSETNVYFEKVAEGPVKEAAYQLHNSLLEKLNDAILFLDNDRYFSNEFEEKGHEELMPKTFKNWFHNLSLNPERRAEFHSIIKEVARFKPNGDGNFTHNEKNSPIHSGLKFEFGRVYNDIELFLSTGTGEVYPLSNFGTGIQQVLYILAKIAEKKPKIILIEEIELNLSPRYQFELIQHVMTHLIKEELNQRNMFQLFFTTHSPLLCVNSQFIVYRVTIDANGETSASKLNQEQRDEIKKFYPDAVLKFD